MRVREFRLRLKNALGARPDLASDAEIHAFLEILADLDDMDFGTLLRLLRPRTRRKPATDPMPEAAVAVDVTEIVSRLRSAFPDDHAFDSVLAELHAQRSVTKAILAQAFLSLFERTRGVPKKATRDELLRLIADERNILVRNEKMGKLLGRRVVPAE